MNITYCEYGCNNEAKYILKNGKHCCQPYFSQCPSIRKKNSEGLKQAYSLGSKSQRYNTSLSNKEKLKKNTEDRIQKQIKEAFVINSKASNQSINNYLLNYLHWPKICSRCGLNTWQGQPIPLELHHKNGDNRDNRLENLEYLCLNCHAITSNFRGKNLNSGKSKVSDEQLIKALQTQPSIRQVLLSVGLSPKGGNYKRAYTLKEYIKNIEVAEK